MTTNPVQHRLLRLVAATPPDRLRASWQGEGGTLAPVTDPVTDPVTPPPGATAVLFWRVAEGTEQGAAFKGQAMARCAIPLPDLEALAPCWSVPWRELNAYGLAFDERAVPIRSIGANGAHGVELDRLRKIAFERLHFASDAPVRGADESEKDHAARVRTWRNSFNTAYDRTLKQLGATGKLVIRDGFAWEPRSSAKGGA